MGEFRVVAVPSDYKATADFLIEVMGLEVVEVFDEWDEGMLLRAGSGLIELFVAVEGAPGSTSAPWLAWEVTDADREYIRLSSAGANIAGSPRLEAWGHKSFRVHGPDGWTITLYEIVDAPARD